MKEKNFSTKSDSQNGEKEKRRRILSEHAGEGGCLPFFFAFAKSFFEKTLEERFFGK
jgi:hypothetical protein